MCYKSSCALHVLDMYRHRATRTGVLQALAHLLEAAAEQQQERMAKEGEGVVELVQRWMFNLVKKGLTATNLAVRQVLPLCTSSTCFSKHGSVDACLKTYSCDLFDPCGRYMFL